MKRWQSTEKSLRGELDAARDAQARLEAELARAAEAEASAKTSAEALPSLRAEISALERQKEALTVELRSERAAKASLAAEQRQALAERNGALAERKEALAERKGALAERNGALAERKEALAQLARATAEHQVRRVEVFEAEHNQKGAQHREELEERVQRREVQRREVQRWSERRSDLQSDLQSEWRSESHSELGEVPRGGPRGREAKLEKQNVELAHGGSRVGGGGVRGPRRLLQLESTALERELQAERAADRAIMAERDNAAARAAVDDGQGSPRGAAPDAKSTGAGMLLSGGLSTQMRSYAASRPALLHTPPRQLLDTPPRPLLDTPPSARDRGVRLTRSPEARASEGLSNGDGRHGGLVRTTFPKGALKKDEMEAIREARSASPPLPTIAPAWSTDPFSARMAGLHLEECVSPSRLSPAGSAAEYKYDPRRRLSLYDRPTL